MNDRVRVMLRTLIYATVVLFLLPAADDLGGLPVPRYHEAVPQDRAAPSPTERTLETAVETAFREQGISVPAKDPAISLACRRLCEIFDCTNADSSRDWEPQVIQFTLRAHGITDAFYFPIIAQVAEAAEAASLLEETARAQLLKMGINRYGLSFDPRHGGLLAAVFSRRLVQLGPMPRSVEPGSSHLLWGALDEGTQSPTFIQSTPDGSLFQAPLKSSAGLFWTQVFFPEDPGEHIIEVLVDADGPQVASLFPVYVGVEVPTRPVLKAYPDIDESADESSLERQALALINRERGKTSLSPCQWHAGLADEAKDHSRRMARAGRLTHVHLGAPSVLSLDYTENVSLSTSLRASHANLMSSPSHRRNLVDPAVRLCGVGIVALDNGEGNRLLYLTQRFSTGTAK